MSALAFEPCHHHHHARQEVTRRNGCLSPNQRGDSEIDAQQDKGDDAQIRTRMHYAIIGTVDHGTRPVRRGSQRSVRPEVTPRLACKRGEFERQERNKVL